MRIDAAASEGRSRAERLAQELDGLEVDALLVESLVDVRYLTGFTGTSGLALIAAEQAAGHRTGRHRFLTDFRYATQSATQVSDAFDREIVAGDLLEGAVQALASFGSAAGMHLGFDDGSLTVKQHERLSELLGAEWELVPCAGAV